MFHIQDLCNWNIYSRKSTECASPCITCFLFTSAVSLLGRDNSELFLLTPEPLQIGLTITIHSVKGRILTVFLEDLGRKWIKADWPSPRYWNKIVHFHIFDENFREILRRFCKNRLWKIQKSCKFCEIFFFVTFLAKMEIFTVVCIHENRRVSPFYVNIFAKVTNFHETFSQRSINICVYWVNAEFCAANTEPILNARRF